MNGQQEKRANLLFAEYKILLDEIRERIGRSDKIMATGLTVLGAGLVYGIKEKVNEILLVLPIGLCGVIFYAIFNTTIVLTIGGHRKYLAERINSYFGEELLIWETISNKTIHSNISQRCLGYLYALSLITAILTGFITALHYGYAITIAFVVVILSLLVVLVISLVVMGNAFDKSYAISKNSWEKVP